MPRPNPAGTTRRAVLAAAGAGSLAGAVATLFAQGAAGQPRLPTSHAGPSPASPTVSPATYPQSVASGGPTPTGVILWTRVAPDDIVEDESLLVQVAEAETFDDPDTFVAAENLSEETDFTVSVDFDGELSPDSFFHYRFVYDGNASRTGRCRTLPRPNQDKDRLRLAVATCNNFLQGRFGAYAHIAEESVDYLVHLGDLIYENGGEGRHDRTIDLPSGHGKAWTLADFRELHRTYRGDRDMQRALEQHTLIHTWDDHEIVNNRWWNYEEDAPETASHPRGDDPEFMRKLYSRGIEALLEYLPLRAHYDPTAATAREGFRLFRSFQFGELADLFVTDERLYRTPPPEDALGRRDFATPPSPAQDDPDRWMLGAEQRSWLVDGVADSDATWKVWANEVLNAALKLVNAGEEAVYVNYDAWDGFEHERRTIMGAFDRRNVENLVTLTGDMHTYLVTYLKLDYKDASQSEHVTDDGRVGVELMTPAISSDNLADSGLFPPAREEQSFDQGTQTQNPHIEWINSNNYGYTVVEFTDEACTYTAYAVDRTVASTDAPKRLLRAFRVPEGQVELEEIAGDQVPEADGSDLRDAAGTDGPADVTTDGSEAS